MTLTVTTRERVEPGFVPVAAAFVSLGGGVKVGVDEESVVRVGEGEKGGERVGKRVLLTVKLGETLVVEVPQGEREIERLPEFVFVVSAEGEIVMDPLVVALCEGLIEEVGVRVMDTDPRIDALVHPLSVPPRLRADDSVREREGLGESEGSREGETLRV